MVTVTVMVAVMDTRDIMLSPRMRETHTHHYVRTNPRASEKNRLRKQKLGNFSGKQAEKPG
jgi:hypothetical protein